MTEPEPVEWLGALLPREEYNPALVEERDRLADSAKRGDWRQVLMILDGARFSGANDCRVGGRSWFGPLHHAAWHGAPEKIVRALIDRGAWRSLRDGSGLRPVDIAQERGHGSLTEILTPIPAVRLSESDGAAMSRRLAVLVEQAVERAAPSSRGIRHLDVLCLAERDDAVWFPIPGMYGGFAVELVKRRLHVESWNRVVGGSGRAYVITPDRTTLVDEGFV